MARKLFNFYILQIHFGHPVVAPLYLIPASIKFLQHLTKLFTLFVIELYLYRALGIEIIEKYNRFRLLKPLQIQT